MNLLLRTLFLVINSLRRKAHFGELVIVLLLVQRSKLLLVAPLLPLLLLLLLLPLVLRVALLLASSDASGVSVVVVVVVVEAGICSSFNETRSMLCSTPTSKCCNNCGNSSLVNISSVNALKCVGRVVAVAVAAVMAGCVASKSMQ